MSNLKMTVVGGFASGKRTFIESHFLHKPLIESIGSYILPVTTSDTFTLKYADNDRCQVLLNKRCTDLLDSNKLSKIYDLNITNKNEIILSFDKFNELYRYPLESYNEDLRLFNELTIYLNDPFLKFFEISVLNPYSTMDVDINKSVNICNSADIVIHIIDACKALPRDELEFLSLIKTSNLMVVVNRMDMVGRNEAEDVKNFISNRLQPFGIPNIQYVSSLEEHKLFKY